MVRISHAPEKLQFSGWWMWTKMFQNAWQMQWRNVCGHDREYINVFLMNEESQWDFFTSEMYGNISSKVNIWCSRNSHCMLVWIWKTSILTRLLLTNPKQMLVLRTTKGECNAICKCISYRESCRLI